MVEFIINNLYLVCAVIMFSAVIGFIAVFDEDDEVSDPISPALVLGLIWPAALLIFAFGCVFEMFKSYKSKD